MGVAATNELLPFVSLLRFVCFLREAPVGFYFSWPPVELLPTTTNIKECYFFPLWKKNHICLCGSLPQPHDAVRERLCVGLRRTVRLLPNLYLLPYSALQCGTLCHGPRHIMHQPKVRVRGNAH